MKCWELLTFPIRLKLAQKSSSLHATLQRPFLGSIMEPKTGTSRVQKWCIKQWFDPNISIGAPFPLPLKPADMSCSREQVQFLQRWASIEMKLSTEMTGTPRVQLALATDQQTGELRDKWGHGDHSRTQSRSYRARIFSTVGHRYIRSTYWRIAHYRLLALWNRVKVRTVGRNLQSTTLSVINI